MIRLIILGLCLILLTGCGLNIYPLNMQLIEKAIAVQILPTQKQISKQLNLDLKNLQINGVNIDKLSSLLINNLPTYHVEGNYNLTVNLPQRRFTQKTNHFDVYIQQQKEGKTWRLIKPQDSDKTVWKTYLIK